MDKRQHKIAPSILSANFSAIGQAVADIESWKADLIHCDVMDGIFVPNITFGPKMIQDIRPLTNLPLDVHLMIVQPERYVDQFIDAGADYLTIHYESSKKIKDTLLHIRSRGVKSGVVISPDTEVSVLRDVISCADMLLLMSVYPGFGGQKFIEASFERLKALTAMRDAFNPEALVEIDGGVTLDNVTQIKACGADVIVAGNTIFGSAMPTEAVLQLRTRQ